MGRGRAGVRGKTAGRGTKGWGARHNPKPGFEGGQMPLQRRVPKLKGFTNPNRVEYAVVNVERARRGVRRRRGHPEALLEHGLVRKGRPVKVLARGEIDQALDGPGARVLATRPRRRSSRPAAPSRGPAADRAVRIGTTVLRAFVNAFKVPDLRNKILFTLFIIAVYRFGSHVPVPVVDINELQRTR